MTEPSSQWTNPPHEPKSVSSSTADPLNNITNNLTNNFNFAALALDVGRKRIGVAGCDRLGLFAHGLTTIIRQGWAVDMQALAAIVQERQVEVLVIGLPYNMDGTLGPQAHQVQKFAQGASKHLQLPVEFVDERLTSFEAEQMMHRDRISSRDHKAMIDRKAAALILQQWLEQKKQSRCESPLLS
ncbi:MAG: Holliday junction resolvase RuvX [Pseudanabaenaceae cyanobacterium]|jgi:putative Holliday junction resolvase